MAVNLDVIKWPAENVVTSWEDFLVVINGIQDVYFIKGRA